MIALREENQQNGQAKVSQTDAVKVLNAPQTRKEWNKPALSWKWKASQLNNASDQSCAVKLSPWTVRISPTNALTVMLVQEICQWESFLDSAQAMRTVAEMKLETHARTLKPKVSLSKPVLTELSVGNVLLKME